MWQELGEWRQVRVLPLQGRMEGFVGHVHYRGAERTHWCPLASGRRLWKQAGVKAGEGWVGVQHSGSHLPENWNFQLDCLFCFFQNLGSCGVP